MTPGPEFEYEEGLEFDEDSRMNPPPDDECGEE